MVTFICEGWTDHDAIRRVYENPDQVHTIVLHGTKFNNSIRSQIEEAMQKGKVYILTDPDSSGDHIARVISDYYGLSRIEADPLKARFFRTGKGYKYGIEYCSVDYLRELLGGYVE
jgi:ribonuclease M5